KAGETLDGRLIGYPMDTGPLALYYRHDFFEQAGLPTEPDDVTAQFAEWEDYFEAGLELQQALPGVRMMDNVPYIYLITLMQAQECYVNRDQVYGGDLRRGWRIGPPRLGCRAPGLRDGPRRPGQPLHPGLERGGQREQLRLVRRRGLDEAVPPRVREQRRRHMARRPDPWRPRQPGRLLHRHHQIRAQQGALFRADPHDHVAREPGTDVQVAQPLPLGKRRAGGSGHVG